MTRLEQLFVYNLIANYIGVLISMNITYQRIKEVGCGDEHHNLARFTLMCFLLMTYLEFYSSAKFFFLMQLEGIAQLIPLKVFHYLFLVEYITFKGTRIFALTYLIVDIICILVFWKHKDEFFAEIYHEYNIRLGCDVNVSNAFIARNIFAMSKYYVLVLNLMMFFYTLTTSRYSNYPLYNLVKTVFLVVEGSITYTGNREITGRKYISLGIYSMFSISGILIIAHIIRHNSVQTYIFLIINELNTLFTTCTNYYDFYWYGCGLDRDGRKKRTTHL